MSKPFLSVDGWFWILSSRGSQEGTVDCEEIVGPEGSRLECLVGDRETAERRARELAFENPGVRYYVAENRIGFLGAVEVTEEEAA